MLSPSSSCVSSLSSARRQATTARRCARPATRARALAHIGSAAAEAPADDGPAAARDAAAAPSRRAALASAALAALAALSSPAPASAAGFRKDLKKRKVPLEEYSVSEADGLRYYDVDPGRTGSSPVKKGDTATVHFDCVYRGIDAVSSRYARTLGGNRTVAEPFGFTAGFPLPTVQERMAASGSGGGGLFAGGTGPQPPAALATAVLGMRQGGKRLVYVDAAELGYPKGNQEIPAGAAFELKIELLSVVPVGGK